MASNNNINPNTNVLEVAMHAAKEAPACPNNFELYRKYHDTGVCLKKPSRPSTGQPDRGLIYNALLEGGAGASMVPDQKTVTCPLHNVASLESNRATKGFDTTWIVENTSSKAVVVAWVIDGIEYSPFTPDLKPIDDPKALLNPGEWTSVPTYESFVYHVREIDETGKAGNVVLQHRAGMIPLGRKASPDEKAHIDPEPFPPPKLDPVHPRKVEKEIEAGRLSPLLDRKCNIIDIGFRNEAGFPLSVFWAGTMVDVPDNGFTCGEKYKFHMGLNAAPQNFMWDWGSKTKYEGSFIGHTYVARRADDPKVVVDRFTIEPTRIIDCPNPKKQQVVAIPAKNDVGEEVRGGESCPNDGSSSNNHNGLSSRAAAAGLSGNSG